MRCRAVAWRRPTVLGCDGSLSASAARSLRSRWRRQRGGGSWSRSCTLAAWRVEYASWLRWGDVVLPILVSGLEVLVKTERGFATRQFKTRVPMLAEEVGVEGVTDDLCERMYDTRSEWVHGARVRLFAGPAEERRAEKQGLTQPRRPTASRRFAARRTCFEPRSDRRSRRRISAASSRVTTRFGHAGRSHNGGERLPPGGGSPLERRAPAERQRQQSRVQAGSSTRLSGGRAAPLRRFHLAQGGTRAATRECREQAFGACDDAGKPER